jgi:hypothetical protein
MLIAVEKGKSQIYRRYKGHRDEHDNGRVSAEDEITSIVLGPLRYLSPKDVVSFWQKLLGEDFLIDQNPAKAIVEFWPNRTTPKGRIQPDLLISFTWNDGSKRILLVEIKWNSGLSGDDHQLKRQWKDFLNSSERTIAHHVFIGKDESVGKGAHSHISAVSWREVRDILDTFSKQDNPLESSLVRWASSASIFLEKVLTRPFKGFPSAQGMESGFSDVNFYAGRSRYFSDFPEDLATDDIDLSFYVKGTDV